MTEGTRPVREDPPPAPAAPAVEVHIGDTVHDTARDRVGAVLAHQGPYFQLRPLGGGREWDVDPAHVRSLSPPELLSARLTQANTRSRTRLGLGASQLRD
ncbi:hypothetical protein ACFV85_24495 [Streptomyces niveus]|uniref:hypothetical protein n=1 Tax=Streptomyces niveus TaxID=193462 RepID=UPI00364A8AD2